LSQRVSRACPHSACLSTFHARPNANADPAAVAFNSVASSDRPLAAARQFEEINLSPFAHLLIDGSNVLAIHGLNDSIASSEFLSDAQIIAGRRREPTVEGFLSTPTPGSANSATFAGFVADTTFSIDRGFYSTAQSVEITTPTLGATIVYTTNGSEPTLTNGTAVAAVDANTAPVAVVNINKTTTLRAAAFNTGMQPTNADTQTYIFVADVVNQSVLSPTIRNHPVWGPQLAGSLTNVPTISIVTPNSISQTEQETSVEMAFPDGTPGFQIDAGIETFGGTSLGFAKQSMRLSFKAEYGATQRRFPAISTATARSTERTPRFSFALSARNWADTAPWAMRPETVVSISSTWRWCKLRSDLRCRQPLPLPKPSWPWPTHRWATVSCSKNAPRIRRASYASTGAILKFPAPRAPSRPSTLP
jgi:hypothetical protein